ncbi:unnamed protein product, partial [Rotaria magnacalcarata]
QINFLNDVIVELRNTNEHLTKEIEFLKNPFVDDNELPESAATTTKTSAPRLYCKFNPLRPDVAIWQHCVDILRKI